MAKVSERAVRCKCALIVRERRGKLINKLLDAQQIEKSCLRRVIRLLHEIEDEILGNAPVIETNVITATGDFSPEEIERALEIIADAANPFE